MPKLDRLSAEGKIVQWLKVDRELVEKGQVICLVETAKTTFEIEAPETGILYGQIGTGTDVPVGQTLAFIRSLNENFQPTDIPPVAESTAIANSDAYGVKEVLAAPSVRRAARERRIDLSKVKGTGPDDRILLKDLVAQTQEDKSAEPVSEDLTVLETIPVIGWRKVMSDRMSLSSRELAQITTMAEVDVTEMLSLKKQLQAGKEKQGLTYTAFIVKAASQAIKKHPIINSSMQGDKIVVFESCNIGVAIAREDFGLIVPVIHQADKRSIWEIAEIVHMFSERAVKNTFSPQDLSNGTFTITNPGMMGVLMNTPLINYPQSAILGVGAITNRPVVRDSQIVVRSMMILSLSYDHRIIDGAPAIRFLQDVKRLLEEPARLLP
jgi:pyruvate dehydrogenase E2 component (dihydrolipoamide acetyltransferase)